ncbi:MAG: DUF2232 domain-containing protein, partial [Alphaproteobacteria bacterium]|nr:DUF2232 domain-containing protein [Alphaproteobacteria bacterium]
MSQALALAVLAGIISGGLGLAPLSGSFGLVLIGYFVQLPMMLAGLTLGLAAALIAASTATLLSAMIAGLLPALVFVIAFALPALWLVRRALLSRQDQGADLVWFPPGLILAELAVMAVLALGLAFFAFTNQPGGLLGVIESMLSQAFEQLSAAAGRPVPDAEFLKSRALFVPAVVACSWLIMAVVNGVLAQTIAVRSGWNRRPSPELAELELPFWLWPLIGVAALLALMGPTGLGLFGRSALIVLVVPFGFLGLAVIHKFANRWPYRQIGLTAVYIGI